MTEITETDREIEKQKNSILICTHCNKSSPFWDTNGVTTDCGYDYKCPHCGEYTTSDVIEIIKVENISDEEAIKLITELREHPENIQISSRYEDILPTMKEFNEMCEGPCEGMGMVPIKSDEEDSELLKRWKEAEDKEHAEDGWHFVTCPICEGTGRKKDD